MSCSRSLSLGKKLAFSAAVFVLIFGSLETTLWVLGTRTLLEEGDPFAGFSGVVKVYEASGSRYRTRLGNGRTFNDQSFLREKPANGYRIFTLGGSSAFGFPWGGDAAFAAISGDVLAARHPDRVVEVVNAAGTSYAMHRLNLIADEVLEYAPDLLVIYSGHNEFIEPAFYEALKNRGRVHQNLEAGLARTRLYSALRRLRDRLATPKPAAPTHGLGVEVRRDETGLYTPAQKQRVVEDFRRGLERLVSRASARKVPVLLMTVPANLSRWAPEASILGRKGDGNAAPGWAAAFSGAREAIGRRDLEAAVPLLERAAQLEPGHPETLFLLASAYEMTGRVEAAAEYYARACDADASPIRRTSEINDAIRAVAKAHSLPLIDADAIFRAASPGGLIGFDWIEDYVHPTQRGHALLAFHLSRVIEGLSVFGPNIKPLSWSSFQEIYTRREISVPDDNATWFYNTAVVLSRQGRYAEAIRKYEEALSRTPDYPAATLNLTSLLVQTGQSERAIALLERLIERNPGQEGAFLNLGNALQDVGRFEEATRAYESVLALSPESALAHNNLGNAYQSLGEFDTAEHHFRTALALRPNYANAHSNWGNLLKRQGRFREALEKYASALRIEPAHANTKRGRASVQKALRRADLVRGH